jgi:hypothetical protein
MTTETKRDLNADLAICDAATAGPWRYCGDKWGDLIAYSPELRGFHNNGGELAELDGPNCVGNAAFITEARTGWPHSIKRAMAAEAEVERLRVEMLSAELALNAITEDCQFLGEERRRLTESNERMREYAGFLRSVILCGERLPDDYSIADFERTVTADATRKETGSTED